MASGGAREGMAANGPPYQPITSEQALSALRSVPLFAAFDPADFARVEQLIRTEQIPRGKLIYEQGQYNSSLYLIRRGKVAVHRAPPGSREEFVGFLGPGAVLNDFAFATGGHNGETLESDTPVTVWLVRRADFEALLDAHPAMRAKLQVTPEARDVLVRKSKYAWQQADEVILYEGRKHWWTFVRTLWLPVTMIIAAGLFYLAFREVFLAITPIIPFVSVLPGVWIAWYFIDWQNDYYVVTDKRVVRRERILFLRDDESNVPVAQVQNVSVARTNLMELLFNMGDIEVEAQGAQSRLRFDDVPAPDYVKEVIFEGRERAKAEAYASNRAKIRLQLRQEIGLGEAERQAAARKAAAAQIRGRDLVRSDLQKRVSGLAKGLRAARKTFFPYVRIDQDGTITYRQHWLELLRNIGLPLASFIGSAILLAVLVSGQWLALALPVFIGLIIALGWLVWQYEDWRNDVYVLAADRIIDIARSPFGLRGTKRKEASYSVVQNVEASTQGFIELVFNVGDVIIRTAGAQGELTFSRVYDPRGVQQDVQERWAAFKQKQSEQESARRRLELTEWIGIYDELRRTHPPA